MQRTNHLMETNILKACKSKPYCTLILIINVYNIKILMSFLQGFQEDQWQWFGKASLITYLHFPLHVICSTRTCSQPGLPDLSIKTSPMPHCPNIKTQNMPLQDLKQIFCITRIFKSLYRLVVIIKTCNMSNLCINMSSWENNNPTQWENHRIGNPALNIFIRHKHT